MTSAKVQSDYNPNLLHILTPTPHPHTPSYLNALLQKISKCDGSFLIQLSRSQICALVHGMSNKHAEGQEGRGRRLAGAKY